MKVTNNIKMVRKERKLTQKELGEGVNCDARTISRYENGERCPSLDMALRLSAYLKLSTDIIFKLEEEPGR